MTEGIESGEYGLDEATNVRGPSGIEIDVNKCPADWSNTEGIGDTITVGYGGPESGNLAAYGNMGIGWETYFDYVNEGGGIGSKQLELIKRDDQCVPNPLVNTGHPAWGDPLGYNWTTGSFLNYLTEANLWGA